MLIRYYLAPIVQIPPRDMNAPKVHMYMDPNVPEGYSCVNSYPYKNWALVHVDADQDTHTAIQADTDITLIPFWNETGEYLPLNALVLQVAQPYRGNIATFLENHRIPTGWITGTHTLGQVLRYVIFPHMIPSFFTGMRLAMTGVLLGVLLAELYVSTAGIGYFTTLFTQNFDPTRLLGLIVVLAAMAIVLNEIVRSGEVYFGRWHTD